MAKSSPMSLLSSGCRRSLLILRSYLSKEVLMARLKRLLSILRIGCLPLWTLGSSLLNR